MMDTAEEAYKIVEKHTNSAINFTRSIFGDNFPTSDAGCNLIASMVETASKNYQASIISFSLDKLIKSIDSINDTLRGRI